MSDDYNQQGRSLEEEYFPRQNKEAIEKLRQKMKVAEEAKAAGTLVNEMSALRWQSEGK